MWSIELGLADLRFIVLLVPSPNTIQFWVLTIEFCFVLAPINPSFSLKTEKVVCGDCWSTEGMLHLGLLPEGSSMFSVNKRPFKIPAKDLDFHLILRQKSPACIFFSDSDRVVFVFYLLVA